MNASGKKCCPECGTAWPSLGAPWPRVCTACNRTTWRNLTPVGAALIPLSDFPTGSVLGIVRGPAVETTGGIALPGGFLEAPAPTPPLRHPEYHWALDTAREVREETGLSVVLAPLPTVHGIASATTHPENLLVFGVALQPCSFYEAVRNFKPNDEVSALVPVTNPDLLCWTTHQDAMRSYQHLLEDRERNFRNSNVAERLRVLLSVHPELREEPSLLSEIRRLVRG